jgi:hypothetical protein
VRRLTPNQQRVLRKFDAKDVLDYGSKDPVVERLVARGLLAVVPGSCRRPRMVRGRYAEGSGGCKYIITDAGRAARGGFEGLRGCGCGGRR